VVCCRASHVRLSVLAYKRFSVGVGNVTLRLSSLTIFTYHTCTFVLYISELTW
jgi:hypothetical protein